MQIEFLVEDISGGTLIHKIMGKYQQEYPEYPIKYTVLPYKGIGGFSKGSVVANVKAQQLLNDLPKRLKAIQAKYWGQKDVSIFVVLDNDIRDNY